MTGLHAALAALAEKWETEAAHPTGHSLLVQVYGNLAREVRALVAEHPADLPVATDSTTADQERGLYGKYRVERLSDPAGKHADCRYFVLDPQHDIFAYDALEFYANHVDQLGYPDLAHDLHEWIAQLDPGDIPFPDSEVSDG